MRKEAIFRQTALVDQKKRSRDAEKLHFSFFMHTHTHCTKYELYDKSAFGSCQVCRRFQENKEKAEKEVRRRMLFQNVNRNERFCI